MVPVKVGTNLFQHLGQKHIVEYKQAKKTQAEEMLAAFDAQPKRKQMTQLSTAAALASLIWN